MYHNYDIVIHLDGDGQHRPSELPLFLRKIEETDADIVVGSRILGSNHPNAPFFRKVFLPYFTWLINKLTGYKMTDSMCGFRAYQRKALLKLQLNNMLEPEYLAPELFMRASKVRLKISEVPVTLEDRDHGESHKGCIRYGYGILKAMLVVFLDKTYHMKRE